MSKGNANAGEALVIGGSIAGLLAARVLSDHFATVRVFERDRLPEQPQERVGVPQASHIHALLTKGQQLLEGFLPGITQEIVAAGAHLVDHIKDRKRLVPYGWQPRFASELRMLIVSRPMLEHHIRRRVLAIPNIEVHQNTLVDDLRVDGRRVTGIVTAGPDGEHEVAGDLVVDASGRSSNAREWMEAHGFGAVEEVKVDAKWGYATRHFETPDPWPYDWKSLNMWPQFRRSDAQKRRGGVVNMLEGGRCIVTLVGNSGDLPPRDEAGFLAFAESLVSPEIADFVRRARPVSPITVWQSTMNRLRRFDRCSVQPENFVVVGDAVTAFNPAYAQGITCAALEARELGDALAALPAVAPEHLIGFAGRVQAGIVEAGRFAWAMSTRSDALIAGVEDADANSATLRAYVERAMALGSIDPQFVIHCERMANLVSDDAWMYEPAVKQLVLQHWDRLGQVAGAPAVPAPAL